MSTLALPLIVLGVDQALTRDLSQRGLDAGKARSLVDQAFGRITLSCALALTASLLAWMYVPAPFLTFEIFVVALALVLLAPRRVAEAYLRCCAHSAGTLSIEQIVRPVTYITLLSLVWLAFGGMNTGLISLPYLGSLLLALVITAALTKQSLNRQAESEQTGLIHEVAVTQPKEPSFILMMLSLSYLIPQNFDVVYLSLWWEASEAGIYRLGQRIAELSILTQFAASFLYGPRLVTALNSDRKLFIAQLKRANRIVLISGGVITILIVIAFDYTIAAIDPELAAAKLILLIVCCGQLVNLVGGVSASIIPLIGGARVLLRYNALICVGNVIANILLIPPLGAIGAAITFASTLIGMTCVQVHFVRVHLDMRVGDVFWSVGMRRLGS